MLIVWYLIITKTILRLPFFCIIPIKLNFNYKTSATSAKIVGQIYDKQSMFTAHNLPRPLNIFHKYAHDILYVSVRIEQLKNPPSLP